MSELPALLPALEAACGNLDGDDKLRAYALSADAYHVAASVMLKLGNHGLAWLAADRSIRAAVSSQAPLEVGSSARIITHALMADGHFGAATQVAASYAQRLAADVPVPSPESLSVFGSLLLRGAIAAAQAEERDASMTLLDEAGRAEPIWAATTTTGGQRSDPPTCCCTGSTLRFVSGTPARRSATPAQSTSTSSL